MSIFQKQDNLTPGSGCPDDSLVVLKILHTCKIGFWKHFPAAGCLDSITILRKNIPRADFFTVPFERLVEKQINLFVSWVNPNRQNKMVCMQLLIYMYSASTKELELVCSLKTHHIHVYYMHMYKLQYRSKVSWHSKLEPWDSIL